MVLALFGCAIQETPQQRAARIEPMLSAAGFHVNAADTPEDAAQQEQMNCMMWPDPYFY